MSAFHEGHRLATASGNQTIGLVKLSLKPASKSLRFVSESLAYLASFKLNSMWDKWKELGQSLDVMAKRSILERSPELRFFDSLPAEVLLNFFLTQFWLLGEQARSTGIRLVKHLLIGTRILDYLISKSGRQTKSARTYIPAGMSVLDFFAALDEQRITYVVLRWFENLPAISEGEDLDLLIADKDYPKFREITDDFNRRGVPIDAYLESGLRPGDYLGHSYFPPSLTSRLISNRTKNSRGIWVPSGRDYFDSMLFHAVFHKGVRLGSSVGRASEGKESEHDYSNVLEQIKNREAIGVVLRNMLEVGRYFQSNGLIPGSEALNLLVRRNDTLVSMGCCVIFGQRIDGFSYAAKAGC